VVGGGGGMVERQRLLWPSHARFAPVQWSQSQQCSPSAPQCSHVPELQSSELLLQSEPVVQHGWSSPPHCAHRASWLKSASPEVHISAADRLQKPVAIIGSAPGDSS
jgi:hypothetical protein